MRVAIAIAVIAALAAPPLEAQTVAAQLPDTNAVSRSWPGPADHRSEVWVMRPPSLPVLRSQQADTLLPVFDDVGMVISEEAIASAMRRASRRQILGGLGGLVAGGLLGAAMGFGQCGILESCSPRDEFHQSAGIWFGAAVGAVLGAGAIAPGADRWRAVEEIRRQRRQSRREP